MLFVPPYALICDNKSKINGWRGKKKSFKVTSMKLTITFFMCPLLLLLHTKMDKTVVFLQSQNTEITRI